MTTRVQTHSHSLMTSLTSKDTYLVHLKAEVSKTPFVLEKVYVLLNSKCLESPTSLLFHCKQQEL
jgi:hypothetical protein